MSVDDTVFCNRELSYFIFRFYPQKLSFLHVPMDCRISSIGVLRGIADSVNDFFNDDSDTHH